VQFARGRINQVVLGMLQEKSVNAGRRRQYDVQKLASSSRGHAMSDVTRILSQIDSGDASAAEQLLPLVYDELRKLAAQRLAQEQPGHTLQATALVHEAYVRLVDVGQAQRWNGSGHFFAAAAEAMRLILVEHVRRKRSLRRGGGLTRRDLDDDHLAAPEPSEDLIALDDALTKLAGEDGTSAELVKLRYFAGLTLSQAAEALDISPRTADRLWAYARAWLRREMHAAEPEPKNF
jgi:RNA polymerase sigma factor (TIGR02999 family)